MISILTPFKNTAEFLPECIESILAQTETNWELIAIDDHSTDESLSIVKRYAERDSRINVFSNVGSGIIPALRLALSKSSGHYVTRMDSDDIMHTEKLSALKNDLLQHGKGHIALGLVQYVSKTTVSEGYREYESWLNTLTKTGSNFTEIYKECCIASPCWMVYREDLERCGAFDSKVYPEDYDLVFRFYKGKMQCIASNQVLHYWRDYDSRTSKTSDHYALDAFLELKTQHFLEIDHDSTRPLVIWGAGNKGKVVAKKLLAQNVSFHWLSIHPQKRGKKIYGQPLCGLDLIDTLKDPVHIITIAEKQAQKEIGVYMSKRLKTPMKDYFLFC